MVGRLPGGASVLLDDGAHGAGRQVHHDEIAVVERMTAAGVHLAVDGDITGLDRYARLGAVLDEAREFEELAELDPTAHGHSRVRNS